MNIEQPEAQYADEDWWQWSVHLAGTPEELGQVDHVIYTLHHTFPKPVRRVQTSQNNFMLRSEGWGEFMIYATVVLKDGSEQRLQHWLELRYPDGTRTTN
jgi:transcription initiation factor IIF auxiliary subunit